MNLIPPVYAQTDGGAADSMFGNIDSPYSPSLGDLCASGPTLFFSNIIKLLIVAAGLFAFINLIIAGYLYIASSGDPKQTVVAWQKISLSLIGLVIMVISFTLAIIIGELLLDDPTAILSPTIYGPGTCD